MELTLPRFGDDSGLQYAAMALLQAPAMALAFYLSRRYPPPAEPPEMLIRPGAV